MPMPWQWRYLLRTYADAHALARERRASREGGAPSRRNTRNVADHLRHDRRLFCRARAKHLDQIVEFVAVNCQLLNADGYLLA